MSTLTLRQRDAFDFIKSFSAENGYGPSYEQIAEGLGLKSRGRAHDLVSGLIARGAIRKAPGCARQYEIIGAHGAEHHLRMMLAEIGVRGTLDREHLTVVEAMRFLGGSAA